MQNIYLSSHYFAEIKTLSMNWILATVFWTWKLAQACRSRLIGMVSAVFEVLRRFNPFAKGPDGIIPGLQHVRAELVRFFDFEKVQVGLRLLFQGELREDSLQHAYATVSVRNNGRSPAYPTRGSNFHQRSLDLERFSAQWDHPLD